MAMTAFASARSGAMGERNYLLIGFATSVAIHVLFIVLWLVVSMVLFAAHLAAMERLKVKEQEEAKRAQQEPPLMFIEVLPEQAVAEPPKDAKFYSSANAVAANPDVQIDTTTPKVEGSQDKVAKTFDTLRPSPPKEVLQPTPKPEPTESEARPKEPPGDLALAKPNPEPKPNEPEKRQRPRTIVEAKMQQGITVSPKLKQEGGVKRNRISASFDTKATTFGAYDAALIAAVQQRWYDVLDENENNFAPRPGKVVIEFRLHPDGRVSDVKVAEQDVGDILALYCRKAIADPAPYAPWPGDMRRSIGKDYRDIRFTFFYM
jgi:outer membrane biosynthesis protein TonB